MKRLLMASIAFLIASTSLAAGSSIQAMIDKAKPGATIKIKKGLHKGPIVIKKPLTLICAKGAVIDGEGKDDVVTIKNTKNVTLQGCTLKNSGTHGWKMDAGIKLVKVKDSLIKNNKIIDCLYGIVTKTTKNTKIVGNEITSKRGYSEGAKGDSIRLWWSPNNLVKDNYIYDSRDVTSIFSNNVIFENDRIENSHIGIVIINSNNNKIIGFNGKNNEVNLLLNCAEDTEIKNFRVVDSGKYRGIVLIRASNTKVTNGIIEHCKKALVVNLSPAKAGSKNYFSNLKIYNNEIGIYLHTTAKQRSRNLFEKIDYKNNKTNLMDEWKTHKQ